MLPTGEMCLLLPNNIRTNFCTLLNLDPLCLINNNVNFKDKFRSNRTVQRCLFDNLSDKINNNDEHKPTVNNIEFAEKLLNEQLTIDRERFINRYNFDILTDDDYSESDMSTSSSGSSCTVTPVKSDPKIRLDENVNEIKNLSASFDDDLVTDDEKETASASTSPDLHPARTAPLLSPTKNKTSVEFRKHPYNSPPKKQSQITDYWKIKRRSSDHALTHTDVKSPSRTSSVHVDAYPLENTPS